MLIYGKFWIILPAHIIKHKHLIAEEHVLMENINKSRLLSAYLLTYILIVKVSLKITSEPFWKKAYGNTMNASLFFLVHFWVIWTPILEARGLTKIILFSTHRYTDLTWIKDIHTHLKCNLVNFEIPNRFLYYGNDFNISKLTRLHFKWVCTSFIQVRSVQRPGENRLTSIWTMLFR